MGEFSCFCLLISGPSGTLGLPPIGKLTLIMDELYWSSLNKKHSFILNINGIKQIQKSPESKPDAKLRIVYVEKSSKDKVDELKQVYVLNFVTSVSNDHPDKAIRETFITTYQQKLAQVNSSPALLLSSASSQSPSMKTLLSYYPNIDWSKIKAEILSEHPDLQAYYKDMVESGLISEEEFWARRESLMLSILFRKQVLPLSSVMPDELKPDEIGESGQIKIKMDKMRMFQVFLKYPKVFEAYSAFVVEKKLISTKEFWNKYLNVQMTKRQQEINLGIKATSTIPSGLAGKAIASMAPTDFFEALKRGEFDSQTASAIDEKHAKRLLDAVDMTVDLAGSAEERIRRGAFSTVSSVSVTESGPDPARKRPHYEGGYGSRDSTKVYDQSSEWQLDTPSSEQAQWQELSKQKSRASEIVVGEVNRYSSIVIQQMNAEVTSVPKVHESGHEAMGNVAASAADDLPDLYEPPDASAGRIPLHVDLAALEEGLAAQTDAPEETAPSASSRGGWTDVSGDSRNKPFLRKKLAQAQGATSRSLASSEDIPDFDLILHPASSPTLELLRAKQSVQVNKQTLKGLLKDSFESIRSKRNRTSSGIPDSVPEVWRDYVVAKFRHNNEVMRHCWSLLSQIDPIIEEPATPSSSPLPSSAAIVSASTSLNKLLQRLQQEFSSFERLKHLLISNGVFSVNPSISSESARSSIIEQKKTDSSVNKDEARATAAAAAASSASATSETLVLLNMLETQATPTMEACERALFLLEEKKRKLAQ
jgi:TFIIH p62 subunit, N-terminal domain